MTVGVIKCRHKNFPLAGDYLLILKFRFLTAHLGDLGPRGNNIHVVPDDEILIQKLYSVKNHGISFLMLYQLYRNTLYDK